MDNEERDNPPKRSWEHDDAAASCHRDGGGSRCFPAWRAAPDPSLTIVVRRPVWRTSGGSDLAEEALDFLLEAGAAAQRLGRGDQHRGRELLVALTDCSRRPMLSTMDPVLVATVWMLELISAVAAPCSVTAEAMASVYWLASPIVVAIAEMASTASPVDIWMA